MRRGRWVAGLAIVALALLVGVGLWRTSGTRATDRVVVTRAPSRVMGTACSLAAVVAPGEETRAEEALLRAEAVLRSVEARMSVWLAESEVSTLNRAGAAGEVPLSPDSRDVLRSARDASVQTAGAFNALCAPLTELWKRAGREGHRPTQAELDTALVLCDWNLIELTVAGARKRDARARVDLGGIAKGYAIDRSIEILLEAGIEAGLVDVGGDLRCFGHPPGGLPWPIVVKNPFGTEPLGRLQLTDLAVCTSGHYARFIEIEGKRYSHIIDPRTGRPAANVPSATVVAPTAMIADIWATALSVLGPQGLEERPPGIEAMLVLGSPEDSRMVSTAGFAELAEPGLRERLAVLTSSSGR